MISGAALHEEGRHRRVRVRTGVEASEETVKGVSIPVAVGVAKAFAKAEVPADLLPTALEIIDAAERHLQRQLMEAREAEEKLVEQVGELQGRAVPGEMGCVAVTAAGATAGDGCRTECQSFYRSVMEADGREVTEEGKAAAPLFGLQAQLSSRGFVHLTLQKWEWNYEDERRQPEREERNGYFSPSKPIFTWPQRNRANSQGKNIWKHVRKIIKELNNSKITAVGCVVLLVLMVTWKYRSGMGTELADTQNVG